jgi:hypothetical protein
MRKKVTEVRCRIRSWFRIGSISQRYGSGDLDPDPHQTVTDPQHWYYQHILFFSRFYDGAGPRQGVSFGEGEEKQEGVEARLGRGGQVQGVREETTGQLHPENEHALQTFAQL